MKGRRHLSHDQNARLPPSPHQPVATAGNLGHPQEATRLRIASDAGSQQSPIELPSHAHAKKRRLPSRPVAYNFQWLGDRLHHCNARTTAAVPRPAGLAWGYEPTTSVHPKGFWAPMSIASCILSNRDDRDNLDVCLLRPTGSERSGQTECGRERGTLLHFESYPAHGLAHPRRVAPDGRSRARVLDG